MWRPQTHFVKEDYVSGSTHMYTLVAARAAASFKSGILVLVGSEVWLSLGGVLYRVGNLSHRNTKQGWATAANAQPTRCQTTKNYKEKENEAQSGMTGPRKRKRVLETWMTNSALHQQNWRDPPQGRQRKQPVPKSSEQPLASKRAKNEICWPARNRL